MINLRYGYFWDKLPKLNSIELQTYHHKQYNSSEKILNHFNDKDLIHHFDGADWWEELEIEDGH